MQCSPFLGQVQFNLLDDIVRIFVSGDNSNNNSNNNNNNNNDDDTYNDNKSYNNNYISCDP